MVIAQDEVNFKPDIRYLRVQLDDPADLKCCYTTNVKSLQLTWVIRVQALNATASPKTVNSSDLVTMEHKTKSDPECGTLSFKSVKLNDTGLYQCWLASGNIYLFSHGTYLQVYSKCLHVCCGGKSSN